METWQARERHAADRDRPGQGLHCNNGKGKSWIEQIHGDGPSNFLDWGGKFREVSLPGERRVCAVRLRESQLNDGLPAVSTGKKPVKKARVRDKLSKALTGEVAEWPNTAVC
jgi:hypothetical protein